MYFFAFIKIRIFFKYKFDLDKIPSFRIELCGHKFLYVSHVIFIDLKIKVNLDGPKDIQPHS